MGFIWNDQIGPIWTVQLGPREICPAAPIWTHICSPIILFMVLMWGFGQSQKIVLLMRITWAYPYGFHFESRCVSQSVAQMGPRADLTAGATVVRNGLAQVDYILFMMCWAMGFNERTINYVIICEQVSPCYLLPFIIRRRTRYNERIFTQQSTVGSNQPLSGCDAQPIDKEYFNIDEVMYETCILWSSIGATWLVHMFHFMWCISQLRHLYLAAATYYLAAAT